MTAVYSFDPLAPLPLSPITGSGPFAAVDTAIIRYQLASFNGCPWPNGDVPTTIEWRDGHWAANPDRPYYRLHDPLDWDAADLDQHQDASLRGILRGTFHAAVGAHVAANIREREIAHKGNGPGWDGRAESGAFCHWGHWSNLRRANFDDKYKGGLARMREIVENGSTARMPPGRELLTGWYELWYASQMAGVTQRWIQVELARAFDVLMGTRLKDYQDPATGEPTVPLAHPKWLSSALRYDHSRAAPRIIEAAADFKDADETMPFELAAMAFWLTGDRAHVDYQLQRVADWVRRPYREIGSPMDGYAGGLGREGRQPRWNALKAAAEKLGITELPKASAGGLPVARSLENRVLVKFDRPPSKITIEIRSYGGDAAAGEYQTFVDVAKSARGSLPAKPGHWRNKYEIICERGVTGIEVHPFDGHQVWVTADVPLRVYLMSGVVYTLPESSAKLEATGSGRLQVRINPDVLPPSQFPPNVGWLNFAANGGPQVGHWVGKSTGFEIAVSGGIAPVSPTVEFAGHAYCRAQIIWLGSGPLAWRVG